MVRRIDTPQAEFELGYWDIRGLAQPIRFLLAYAKAPFSEVRIVVNQDGSLGLPPMSWSTPIVSRGESRHGNQTTQTGRDRHQATAG